ncbi:methyltransferase domain-containing protein [Streptomyces sioyaensis]|uniref:class I SAM-dependent methyltransferase n=1 Tax=Streptomyces sioyaensis TaxID=67364 RepID=UPI001F17EEA6|nr:class I SAM-dependent methyltransferase [Streptomyces sioyaensis]MCF3172865.1 methyltransferase domain-containing protein [Streptomyces sioyaensis]
MMDHTLVARHYESFSEGPRLQKSRVRRLEFDTTLHVLDKYMDQRSVVIELGAGHGAYSFHLSRAGHRVTATDLVDVNVAAMLALAKEKGLDAVDIQQADAMDLDGFNDSSHDAVLCLGPFYHLRTREFRRRCLFECRRVVRDGGIVAVAYINRVFAVNYLLKAGKRVTADQYESLMQPDDERIDYPDEFFNVAHFSTPEAVEDELRSCGFTIVEHAGTDGIGGFFPEILEGLDEDAYQDFRSYHLKTCGQYSHRGASSHCLVIAQKA